MHIGYTPIGSDAITTQPVMTNATRATKAQLINLLNQQATTTSELEHQVTESKEEAAFALWVAAISFVLGLLF